MTTYIHKGYDLLAVDESVMNLLIEMGAIEYADNSNRGIAVEPRSDSVKYDLKITVTKTRRRKNDESIQNRIR